LEIEFRAFLSGFSAFLRLKWKDDANCIYMHMHIVYCMTKVISLSEKAYETLKSLKKPGESFSDVVIRVGSKEKKKSLLEFAGTWHGNDIDEVFAIVLKDREQAKSREFDLE
jgi:Uncharacterized conserved protein